MLDIAEAVGVSEGTVSRWESGNISNMRADRVLKYAEALRVSPEFITGDSDEISVSASFDTEDEDIRIVARKMDKMSTKDRKKLIKLIDTMFEDDNPDQE